MIAIALSSPAIERPPGCHAAIPRGAASDSLSGADRTALGSFHASGGNRRPWAAVLCLSSRRSPRRAREAQRPTDAVRRCAGAGLTSISFAWRYTLSAEHVYLVTLLLILTIMCVLAQTFVPGCHSTATKWGCRRPTLRSLPLRAWCSTTRTASKRSVLRQGIHS